MRARFFKEAPPAWGAYRRRAAGLQGKVTYRSVQAGTRTETTLEIQRHGPDKRVSLARQKAEAGAAPVRSADAFAVNARYAFAVARDEATASWVATDVIDNADGAGDAEFNSVCVQYGVPAALDLLLEVEGEPLPDLVRRPAFRVTSCRAVARGKDNLVEVAFDSPDPRRAHAVERGTLLLDPARSWCLRGYDVRRRHPDGTLAVHLDVQELSGTDPSVPVARRAVYTSKLEGKADATASMSVECNLDLHPRPAKEGCTLTAYGLPEPSGLDWNGPRPWYVWAAVLAAGSLGLGIVAGRPALRCRVTAAGVACCLLFGVHAALAVHSLRQQSVGLDEGGHVLSGLVMWQEGRLDIYPVNPPLVEALAALPVAASGPDLPEGVRRMVLTDWVPPHTRFMHANRDRYLELIFRARYVLVALSVLGGVLVYRWGSQLFGRPAGLVAVALWAFSPTILTWSGVCTVDLGAAVVGLAAAYGLRHYLHRPGWWAAAWVGWLLGLAVLSKFTLLVYYPVFLVVWGLAWCTAPAERSPRWRHFGLALLVSLLVINLGYGFQGTGRPLGGYAFQSGAVRGVVEGLGVHGKWVERLPVPLPEAFLTGLDRQKFRAEHGTPGYLNGQWRQGGWWYWYLAALAFKVPLGTWALAALALGLACRGGRFRAGIVDECLLWLPPAGVVILLSTQMRDQFASIRYLVPAFPFLFIGVSRVGRLLEDARKQFSGSPAAPRRWLLPVGAGLVLVALAGNVVSVVRVHPHYLSYFHELAGGPQNGWRHLLESNYDWGQDLLFLKRWLQAHPEARPLGLAYYGGMDPHVAGLDYRLPPSGLSPAFAGPPAGWYAVSVNFVCGASAGAYDERGRFVGIDRDNFRYFGDYKPVARAGYSIFIYRVVGEPPELHERPRSGGRS